MTELSFDEMDKAYDEIDLAATNLKDQGDKTYNRMHNAWVLPMDIKQMIDQANMLGQMTQFQFNRLVDLAMAFGKDKQG
jgi:hypothetical protein